MSPLEEKLIRALWTRGPLTRAAARAEVRTIARLVDLGLVEELEGAGRRGGGRLGLTEQGRRAAEALPPASPTPQDLYREVAALRREVEAMRRLLDERLPARPTEPVLDMGSRGPSLEDFGARVRALIRQLDRDERHGGLIPIPRVRSLLCAEGWTRAKFDDALLALEERYVVDLKVANDPSRLPDRDEGIETPDRGLLYFVVGR